MLVMYGEKITFLLHAKAEDLRKPCNWKMDMITLRQAAEWESAAKGMF